MRRALPGNCASAAEKAAAQAAPVRVQLESPFAGNSKTARELNQLYLRPETVLRITGGQLEIPPDDLSGEYDIDLTGVAGLAERDKRIQNLQLFLGNLFPMGAQMGLLGPQQWSLAARRLLAESGVNDAANFIPEVGMNGGLPGGPPQGAPGGPMQGVPPALAGQLPTLSPGVAGEGGSLGGRGHVAPEGVADSDEDGDEDPQ